MATDTIDARLNNAADALMHVAGDIFEKSHADLASLVTLLEDRTLGKFNPLKTVVRTLFCKFVSLDEFQDYHFEVLQEYLDNLD